MKVPAGFEHIEDAHGVSSFLLKKNGLQVLVMPKREVPVVGVQVTYHVGSRHESAGHTGATHILEHLMFKGSKKFDPKKGNGIWHRLEKKGAQMNATTWCDRTNYYAVVPVHLTDDALLIEADRMRNILFRREDLMSEMTVVRNEYERGENDPHQRLSKHAWYQAFTLHPYRIPTIGTKEDIENVTVEKLRAFYDRFYHPNNATVSIVGDLDIEAALKKVSAAFGEIPKKEIQEPPYSVEPPQEGERRFELMRRGTVNALLLCFKAPAGLSPDTPSVIALKSVLGAGKSSVLHKTLVDTGLAVGSFIEFPRFKDPSVIELYANLAGGVSHSQAENAVWQAIERLRHDGPGVDELKRAVTFASAEKAYAHASIGGILSGMNESIARGDWKDAFTYEHSITSVSTDAVKDAAMKYFGRNTATVGHLKAV